MIFVAALRRAGRDKLLALFVGAALSMIGAACTSIPMPTATFPTATATPLVQPTLPPTWTPTYTLPPPSSTPTPTVTPTLEPTATLSADDLCAAFSLLGQPHEGARLPWDGTVTFFWDFPVAGAAVTLRLTRLRSDESLILTVPGPDPVVAEVPFHALYGFGDYSWSVTPGDESGQPLASCAAEGRFYIRIRLPAPEESFWGQP